MPNRNLADRKIDEQMINELNTFKLIYPIKSNLSLTGYTEHLDRYGKDIPINFNEQNVVIRDIDTLKKIYYVQIGMALRI